jgi:hypothetical protein
MLSQFLRTQVCFEGSKPNYPLVNDVRHFWIQAPTRLPCNFSDDLQTWRIDLGTTAITVQPENSFSLSPKLGLWLSG